MLWVVNEFKEDSLPQKIEVNGGKYTVVIHDNGGLEAFRYDQPWRDLVGDNLIYWLAIELQDARREVNVKQAEIDGLMLEYCPNEMTATQMEVWEQSQCRSELGYD